MGPLERASIRGGLQDLGQILAVNVGCQCITVFTCLIMEMECGGKPGFNSLPKCTVAFNKMSALLKWCIIFVYFRYSFDYGSVHFMMMSTEHNFTQGSRQYEWMEQDLKNVNHSLTPWVVIAGHRAMYTSQKQLGECNTYLYWLYKYIVYLHNMFSEWSKKFK